MYNCSGKFSGCCDCKFSIFVAVEQPLDVLGAIAAAIAAVEGGRRFNPPPTEFAAHVVVSPGAEASDQLVGLLIKTPTTTEGQLQLSEIRVERLAHDQVRLDIDHRLLLDRECFKIAVIVGHCYNMCFS